jgi:hypothetical protein
MLALMTLVATAVLGGVSSASKIKVTSLVPCNAAALRITVKNGDGLHHGVEFLSFTNVSNTSCTISGYPSVEAMLDSAKDTSQYSGWYAPAPAGTRQAADDAQWAWAGGVDTNDIPLKTFKSPVITLRSHRGSATSTVNWIDGPNGNGTCPAFNSLIIGVDGFSVTRFVRQYEPLCYEFAVTPIVRGTSGRMFVKDDYSVRVDDLAEAQDEEANFLSEAQTLRREWEHPHKFTIYQQIQSASYLQGSAQYVLRHTPWPKLNASLAKVSQEANDLGNYDIMNQVRSGYSREVSKDYAVLLTDVKSLDKLLKKLS